VKAFYATAAILAAALLGFIFWKRSGGTAAGLLRRFDLPSSNGNAALGGAICMGGVAYFGGISAGAASAQLCEGVGEGIAPIVGATVDGASGIIRSGSGAVVGILDATGDTAATLIRAPVAIPTTVAKSVYSGTKSVVGTIGSWF
jgi:hypothetical protein